MESGVRGSKTLMRKFSFPAKHVLHQIVQRGEWRCGSFVEGLFVQDEVDIWYIGVILSLAQATETCCILFADEVHFDFLFIYLFIYLLSYSLFYLLNLLLTISFITF